jgi:hypothetical protein
VDLTSLRTEQTSDLSFGILPSDVIPSLFRDPVRAIGRTTHSTTQGLLSV